MSKLTTHVLDTARGRPGKNITIRLYGQDGALIVETTTNDDGRCDRPLLSDENMKAGKYRLEFEAGDYFRQSGADLPDPAFLDTIVINFGISDPAAHYHVPLLVSPYGYSTYRGS
jgi:5-hydroxyisourate hydrolase